jgi:competence protein ComEC
VSDLWAIALAVATAGGAWAARPVPVWVGAVLAALGLGLRRPALLCLGAFLLATGLSARAWAGTAPLRPAPFHGIVTLLDDPTPVSGGVRVRVRVTGHHVEAWARGGVAWELASREAGEDVDLAGSLGPVAPRMRRRLAELHVAGELQVSFVGDHDDGNLASLAANRVRRALVDGAGSLSPAERALYTGFVLGDDRAEPLDLVDDFRAAGLSHLTAVSGENIS